MRGNTAFVRMNSEIANTTSVQIVSPTLGVISQELDARNTAVGSVGLEEEGDEAADQAVEEGCLGEREPEPLDRGDLVSHLRLAGHRLDHLAEQHPDAGTGPGGAAAGPDPEGDRLPGLLANVVDRSASQP